MSTSATPEKKLGVLLNTSTATKSLTSVIEDHQRRGEVLRKQQQILTKQLLDIQVKLFHVNLNLIIVIRFSICVFQEERNHLELRLQKLHLTDSQC